MSDPAGEFESRLAALRREYALRLPERAAACRALAETLAGGWEEERVRDLAAGLHKLAGSGRTYGFAQVTEQARAAEAALQSACAAGANCAPALREELRRRVDELVATAGQIAQA